MPKTTNDGATGPTSMRMPQGMGEALQLTNAGRLMEATELIQRTLAPGGIGGVSPGSRQDTPGRDVGDRRAPEDSAAWEKTNFDGLKKASASPLGNKLFDLPQNLFDPQTGSSGPAQIRVPESSRVDAPGKGRFVSGSFTNAAGTRGYKLYIPDGIEGEAVPLVVMLHGCTQNPDDFAAGTRMNLLADEGKFFVLYPEQSQGANMQKCWNWFQVGDQIRDRGEPSIIAGITHQVAATQPIDTRRVFVAGMSAGGAMAVVMGETYPDLYAAIGVHSGLPYGAARDMPSAFQAMQGGGQSRGTSRIPTIVFHGDRDTTVSQRNGEQILRRWISPDATGEDATSRPLLAVKKGQVPNGRAYTRSIYRDAGGRTIAEGWMVHGAGHAWAGGDPRGSYTDSSGPDASAEMVRFFQEHPRA